MTNDDWRDFFPVGNEIRPDQERAINFIGAKLKEGVQNIFFEGPPGVGKSFIAWTLAMYFAVEFGWKSRILVPNRFLECQYLRDFSGLGLRQLHSARHYLCPEFVSCDIGRGNEIVVQNKEAAETVAVSEQSVMTFAPPAPAAVMITRCEEEENCPYVHARNAFAGARIGVTNTAYALTCARYHHLFVSSDLLFVDEGHKLNDEICALYRIIIPFDLVDSLPAEGGELPWAINIYMPNLYTRIESANEARLRRVERCPNDPVIQRLTRDIERLNATLSNLNFLTATSPEEWAVTRTRYNVTFQPLWARRMGPHLLGFLAPRRVFISATFLDFEHHLDCLGVAAA
jgi:Rad3-related DNA helicase